MWRLPREQTLRLSGLCISAEVTGSVWHMPITRPRILAIATATATMLATAAPADAIIRGGVPDKAPCAFDGTNYDHGTVITIVEKYPDGTTHTTKRRCNDGHWDTVRIDPVDTLAPDSSADATVGP